MAEPEYPVLKELETKLKLLWVDTDDVLATQRAIIQVEPEAAYLELPRGRKGDKGNPGNAISFQGIVARTSDLPTGLGASDAAKAWVNTATKALHVWNGGQWFTVNNFAGVDADVQQFSQWFAQINSDARRAIDAAERAETAAEETIQQVTGDFATRNYTDNAVSTLASSVNARINYTATIGQATSIAYGAAAALSGESSTPPPVVVEGLPVWDASYPVYLWGDSAIDRGLSGDRLEDYLGAAIHQTVVDNSNGGTPIGDLLFRTGAAPLYGIPVGGVIPAGVTPVEVDRMGADISMTHEGEIPVTWAGVAGKITYYAGRYHVSGYDTVEFTRSVAGDEVPIAAPTRIEPVDVFDPYATHIIVSGGNDASKGYITVAPEGDKAGHLIGSYIKLVEQAAAAPVKHILIGGVKTRADTMPGNENHKLVTQVNNQLKQLFPHIFVDRQRWLCERGPEILGLELTPDEQAQRDAGIVPARVFTDSTHVGSEIRQAEAKELWAFALAQRGWAQLTTPVNGHHMPIMANTITTTDLV